jgi:thiamine-monophosphate kinase
VGIGDDAAVIPGGPGNVVLTVDAFVEGTHFRRTWFTPEQAGWKAVAVNLSDVAAMGAEPVGALVSLILPGSTRIEALRRFHVGLQRAVRRHRTPILGGNLARGDDFSATVTLVGRTPTGGEVLRKGARPGDVLFVTGEPGLAGLGLRLLSQTDEDAEDLWEVPAPTGTNPARRAPGAAPSQVPGGVWGGRAVRRFLTPDPRNAVSRALLAWNPTAMIDTSYGLARDLGHLAATGSRLVVETDRLGTPRGFRRLAQTLGADPLEAALHGGEDYELLFALPPGAAEEVARVGKIAGVTVRRVGRVEKGRPGVFLEGEAGQAPLDHRGFEHWTG